MDDLRLIVRVDSLYLSSGKFPKIHGIIFFQAADFTFPDSLWDDFVVKILGWWIEGMQALVPDEKHGEEIFYFMDGPYRVNVLLNNDTTCNLIFIRSYADVDDVIGEVTVSCDALLAHLIEVAQTVVQKAEGEKWQTENLVILKRLITSPHNR